MDELDQLRRSNTEAQRVIKSYEEALLKLGEKLYSDRLAKLEEDVKTLKSKCESKDFPTYNDELSKIRIDLVEAQIGSCSCLTKTPDYTYHSTSCPYRGLSILIEELEK